MIVTFSPAPIDESPPLLEISLLFEFDLIFTFLSANIFPVFTILPVDVISTSPFCATICPKVFESVSTSIFILFSVPAP